VDGPGTLRVADFGRLFSCDSAKLSSSTLLELADGGTVEGQTTAIPDRQQLNIAGMLLWTGGDTEGQVVLLPKSDLRIRGSGSQRISEGTVVVQGSGVAEKGANLDVDHGMLIIEGSLLLEDGFVMRTGRGFALENKGVLRVADGRISLGDNAATNNGVIIVSGGELHLELLHKSFVQNAGRVVLGSGGKLQSLSTILLKAGKLEGSGRVVANVEQHGTTILGETAGGKLKAPARLEVEGDYTQLGKKSNVEALVNSDLPGSGHSHLAVTGRVSLAGTLHVDAPGFIPAKGTQIDLVQASPHEDIVGRFEVARMPKPTGATFLRVTYDANYVRLATSEVTPGIDTSVYPGDAAMTAWSHASPYRWVCYYLKAPCHPNASWHARRRFLEGLGWGFAVVYVGQQAPGVSPCPRNAMTGLKGDSDGLDAISQANREGFPASTWIYLDV
jgi:hypothetical protein